MTPLEHDRELMLGQVDVSRETLHRLDRFVTLLLLWQGKTNLVALSTLETLWTRHIGDSLQLIELAPTVGTWVDLGSGGGFPGLVIALAGQGRSVHLVDSNMKKCAFLRTVLADVGVSATVHARRIEDVPPSLFLPRAAVVSARALAPLRDLLRLAFPLLKTGALGVFPKGREAQAELTDASRYWTLDVTLAPSRFAHDSAVVLVQSAQPRDGGAI